MAIAFRSSSTVALGTRTNTTGAAPSGAAAGDVLVAVHSVGAVGAVPPAVTGPAGWGAAAATAVYGDAGDNYFVRLTVWVAPFGAVSSYTWTHSSGSSQLLVEAYTGVDTTTPLDVTPSSAVGAANTSVGLTATATSITTVTNGAMLVAARGSWDGNAITPPASWTERWDVPVTWVGELIQTTAGATGAIAVSAGNGSSANPWGIILAALRPASSGTTVNVGQPAETNTAAALTRAKATVAGQPTTADTAAATVRSKNADVGLAAETDTAPSTTSAKTITLGIAADSDTSAPVSEAKGSAVGQATDTSSVHVAAAAKTTDVDQPADANEALPLPSTNAVHVGQASDSDTAHTPAVSKMAVLGIALEQSTALGVTATKVRMVGFAVELDTAHGVAVVRTVAVGQPTDTNTAFAAGRAKTAGVGLAATVDTAFALVDAGAAPIPAASSAGGITTSTATGTISAVTSTGSIRAKVSA